MAARILKIVLTAVLLAALSMLVDWSLVLHTVLQARPEWLGIAALCVVLDRVVVTWRWRTILQASGYVLGFRRLLRVVSAGVGLGALLPTAVGPDVARGVLMRTAPAAGEDRIGTGLLVSSLLIDRYTAGVGTLALATIGAATAGYYAIGAAFALAFAVAIALAMAMMRYAKPLILALTPGPLRRLAPKLETMASYLRRPHMFRRALLPAVGISVLLTFVRVAIFVSLYVSFGYGIPFGLAIFVIPALVVATMAPVTIGGFGLREWLLTIGFLDIGIPAEVSVSVGLLSFFIPVLLSLPAIVLTLMASRSPPAGHRLREGES